MTGPRDLTITQRPSQNCSPRRDGLRPDILLLHYTDMLSAHDAVNWLCSPQSQVSCHYLVDEDGEIVQMVDEELRAWHAGVSSWAGETDINSRSIGIEIHNVGHGGGYLDFPEAQMQAVEGLCLDILSRHDISPERVLAHSDVAPARKVDPGEKFDWARLHRAGIGHWVEPAAPRAGTALAKGDEGKHVRMLQDELRSYGYGIDVSGEFDVATEFVVAAFQRHFRQSRVDGIADDSTRETLRALLRAL